MARVTPVAQIGRFVPGDSPAHRMEARAKLGLAALFTVLLFSVGTSAGLALCAALTLTAILTSRMGLFEPLRGLRPIVFLLAFTLVANALRVRPADALLSLGALGVSRTGLSQGLFFVVRITLLVLATSLLTLTTSPVALTDALSRLMRPLAVVRVPVDDVAMMFSIALRFIPSTAEEAERVVLAQTARGARFDEGGVIRRARAWVPVLVPLFVNLFRRADDLATAMESRCYTGRGRTRLRDSRLASADWLALAVMLGITIAGAVRL